LAAVAESALESESEDKAGPRGKFTPSHLYDLGGLYDPDCDSDLPPEWCAEVLALLMCINAPKKREPRLAGWRR
jgi:hypothetical protein